MITGLLSSATGMSAGSDLLDALAVDLANVNTPGYKRNDIDFAEIAEQAQYLAGRTNGQTGTANPGPGQVAQDWVKTAYGIAKTASVRDFTQGTILSTEQPLDLAIQGKGFFAVRNVDGSLGYTRAGAFRTDENGRIVDPQGRFLLSSSGNILALPSGWHDLAIDSGGMMTVLVPSTSPAAGPGPAAVPGNTLETVGQVGLAYTEAPQNLVPNGGVFAADPATRGPILGLAGTDGRGTIQQGALEQSNVDMAAAMVALIVAQRAYTLSARAFTSADQMWNEANSLSQTL